MIYSKFSNLVLASTIALQAVTSASNFAFTNGDLILGFQASGGTGSTKNVFVNLGSGVNARNGVGLDTVKANIGSTLSSVFGANWYTRSDIWFGVLGNLNANANSGVGSRPAVDGDPSRTWYVSRAASTAGSAALIGAGTYVPSSLGTAGTNFGGLEGFLPNLTAQADGTAILDQSANQTEWNNSWTKWNPIVGGAQGASLLIFTGGVQQTFGQSGSETFIDLQRILSTTTGADPTGVVGGGTYVATVSISNTGAIRLIKASASTPEIATVGSPALLNTTAGTASDASSFNVSGANMTAGITVTAPNGFEVSTSSNASFSSNITVGTSGTIASTPVYVRIPASASSGNFTGNITLSSTGAESKNISVSGTVTAPTPVISVSGSLTALSTTYGTASSTSNFTVSGTNMTAPVTVTAPAGFEVSTSSTSGFAPSISVPASGTLSNTTIHVRLSPTADSGTYSGNISLTSTGATEKTIATVSSTISKATQSIAPFTSIGDKAFGDAAFKVTAPAASSGLSVALSVKSGPATISENNTVTLTGAGTVEIAANQSGNANYNAASEETTRFTVSKSAQTIGAFASIGNKTFGDAPFSVTAPTASSGLPVTLSVISGHASISNNTTVTINGAGTVTLAANQAGNDNYTAATEVRTTFSVAKASITLTSNPTASPIKKGQTLSQSNLTGGSASAAGAPVAGKFAFADENTAPEAGTSNHSVIFTPTDSANYNTFTLDVSVTVNESSLPALTSPNTTSGDCFQPFQYEIDATNNPTGFAANNLPKGLSINTGTGLISGTPTKAGVYDVTLTITNIAGDSESTLKITIKKASSTVTLGNLTHTYDGTPKSANATTSPLITGDVITYTYTGISPTVYPESSIPPTQAGSYTVVGTINDANYSGNTTGTLTIDKAKPAIISLPTAAEITYGSQLSAATLNATNSVVNGVSGPLSVVQNWSYTDGTFVPPAGNYTASVTYNPSSANTANYTSSSGNITVTVNKATPTIARPPTAAEITYGSPLSAATLNATNAVANGVSGPLSDGIWTYTDGTFVPPAGNYTASVTYNPSSANTANYTSSSGNITVKVNKATPTIDRPPTASPITLGQKLSESRLSGGIASVNGTFAFTNPNTQPSTVGTSSHSVTFTPADTDNYLTTTTSVEVDTLAGSSPVIASQPNDLTVLQGNSATFSVQATGQNLSYQWKRNGVDIIDARNSSYTVSSTLIATAGAYSVVVSSDNGSQPITSRVAKLIVTFPLADLTINENTSPVLSVSVTGTGLKYQWFKDGILLYRETDSILKIKDITVDQAGTYSVEVTDTNGNKFTSQSSKVTVNAVLPEITTQPSNVSVYIGGSATMRVMVKGSGHAYQWRKNGINIPGETRNTLTLTDIILADAGEYSVSITNSVGSVTSRSARLRVLASNSNNQGGATARPTITSHPISQTVANGSRVLLSVRASGGGLLYQWRKNRKNITGANQSSYTIPAASSSDSGDYAVIVYNSLGTVTSNIARIAISAPEIDVQQPAGSSLVSSTSKISFGTAKTSSAGIRRTFTIRNTGTTRLTGISFSKSGSHQSDFTVSRSNLREVAPGSSATFTVTFRPAAIGARTASIRIASNDRDENPFIINLAGQGAR